MNRLSDLVAFTTAGVAQAVLPNVTPLEQLKNDLFGKSFRLDEKLNMREAALSKGEQDIGNNFFLAKLSCPTPPTLAGIEKLEAKFDKAYQLATNGDLSELVKSPLILVNPYLAFAAVYPLVQKKGEVFDPTKRDVATVAWVSRQEFTLNSLVRSISEKTKVYVPFEFEDGVCDVRGVMTPLKDSEIGDGFSHELFLPKTTQANHLVGEVYWLKTYPYVEYKLKGEGTLSLNEFLTLPERDIAPLNAGLKVAKKDDNGHFKKPERNLAKEAALAEWAAFEASLSASGVVEDEAKQKAAVLARREKMGTFEKQLFKTAGYANERVFLGGMTLAEKIAACPSNYAMGLEEILEELQGNSPNKKKAREEAKRKVQRNPRSNYYDAISNSLDFLQAVIKAMGSVVVRSEKVGVLFYANEETQYSLDTKSDCLTLSNPYGRVVLDFRPTLISQIAEARGVSVLAQAVASIKAAMDKLVPLIPKPLGFYTLGERDDLLTNKSSLTALPFNKLIGLRLQGTTLSLVSRENNKVLAETKSVNQFDINEAWSLLASDSIPQFNTPNRIYLDTSIAALPESQVVPVWWPLKDVAMKVSGTYFVAKGALPETTDLDMVEIIPNVGEVSFYFLPTTSPVERKRRLLAKAKVCVWLDNETLLEKLPIQKNVLDTLLAWKEAYARLKSLRLDQLLKA